MSARGNGLRRVHLLCVGAPKTGTHSVAGIFGSFFRSAHEPEAEGLIEIATQYLKGADEDSIIEQLRVRDQRLGLEVESSNPLGVLTPVLLRAFPAATFIVTVRDPMDWLCSEINSHLLTGHDGERAAAVGGSSEEWPGPARSDLWRRLRFGVDPDGSPIKAHLTPVGPFPTEGYLKYWARHYRACLAAVTAKRALVVMTSQLSSSVEALARYVGVDADVLDHRASHGFAAPTRSPLLSRLRRPEVSEAVERACGPLWRAYQLIERQQDAGAGTKAAT